MQHVNVFITVDTEVWPKTSTWRETALADDIRRDFYGITSEGEFGVPYQMDVLDAFRLKAVFFVESLFAGVIGLEQLREMVSLIQRRGHEVQLHAHTEWLAWMPKPLLGERRGQNLKDFSEDEQTTLIGQ